MNRYDNGDLVRLTFTFSDADGIAQDPDGVIVKYKDPSGNETTLTYGVDVAVVKDSTGVYHIDLDVDEEGRWFYRCEGSGSTQQAAVEGQLIAQDSEFT